MEEFLFHPILWIVIAVALVGVIVASIIISAKRSKEVEELDKMFPEGKLAGQHLEKIPVEKVRRTTIERERRKREREKRLPKRVRPKEGEKVFAEEDQEIILNTPRRTLSTSNQHSNPSMKQQPLQSKTKRFESKAEENIDRKKEAQSMYQQSDKQSVSSNVERKSTSTTKMNSYQTNRQRSSERPSASQASAHTNEAELQAEQTNSSKYQPFARSDRSQTTGFNRSNAVSKDMPPRTAQRPFSPRSKRSEQEPVDHKQVNEQSKQSLKSRSTKYSVKKRLF